MLYFFTGHAYLFKTQSYGPTYPEIWGYDLSDVPAVKWGGSGIQAYAVNDGDIWFVIEHSYKTQSALSKKSIYKNKKYTLIKFFRNEKQELSLLQKNKIIDRVRNQKVPLPSLDSEGLTFKDGSKLSIRYRSSSKSCYINSFSYGWLTNTLADNTEKKYIIFSPTMQVKTYTDKGLCDLKSASFFYEKISMVSNIIPLEDDTFIAFSDEGLIIRMDKNFKTQFPPLSSVSINHKSYLPRTFYIINYSLIEKLENDFSLLPVPFYQSIHDALLIHFYTKSRCI